MHSSADSACHRRLALAAFLVAAVLLGVPCSSVVSQDELSCGTESTIAETEERVLRIGWAPYLEISTLNPLRSVYDAEMMVVWSCYSTLLTHGANGEVTGNLATSWELSPNGLIWTIDIVETASFYNKNDPEAYHRLTVEDVIFTYWLVQNTSNYIQYLLPDIPGAGGRPISDMEKITDFKMRFILRTEYAPFLNALTVIPILPKYIWEGRPWSWANYDSATNIPPCVGSGTWYYALDTLPTFGLVELRRNDKWFAIEEYGWKPRPTSILLLQETEESNLQAYSDGQTDIMLGGTRAQFSAGVSGQTWGSSQGYVLEFNMNQMSTVMRDQLVAAGRTNFGGGTNNQLLLDPVIKLALRMCVDKEVFVEDVLDGWGTSADSLVPLVSQWHYTYGSAPGETPIPFDTAGSRSLLWANGWKYDAAGNEVSETSTQCPLYGYVGDVLTPLEFRFYTINTDLMYIDGATLIADRAAQAGVKLNLTIKSMGQMNSIWWAADYDAWLWNWAFTPMSDPSTDIMSLLTTADIGSWSDVFWSNSTFDALYNESIREMDPTSRKLVLDEMQRMAYLHSGCWPVAYADELYAAQSVAPANWQNYGNWTEDYTLTPDSGYPWLFLQIYPADNPPPEISELGTLPDVFVNTPLDLTAFATDDSEMEYLWNFGDGTKSGWLASPNTAHTYTSDGLYTVHFAAKEVSSTNDYHISSKTTTVRVVDGGNKAPNNLSISYVPTSPSNGVLMTFTGSATDHEGDQLYFSWDFGDMYKAIGNEVSHRYAVSGNYTVRMYVTDNHIGTEPRPVELNVSISVSENRPPLVDVPALQTYRWKQSTMFRVNASDPDGDPLRFTWFWGDGTFDVTTTSWANHTYTFRQLYTLTVYADDLTKLSGHNVSDTGYVTVGPPNNDPVVTAWSVSKTNPYAGEVVTFTASAKDKDGDFLTFTLDFGDGSRSVQVAVANPNQVITFNVDKRYTSAGTFTACLYVSDGSVTVASDPIVMSIDPASFALSLVAGWNLVTVPLAGHSYKASTLGLNHGDAVVRWHPGGWYDPAYIVSISPSTMDFEILEGEAYWIYSNSAKTLNLLGDYPTGTKTISIDVPAGGGWALIGLTSLKTWNASDVFGMCTSGSILIVVGFDPVSQIYRPYYPSFPFTDFLIPPGRGFWVYCASGTELAYDA